MSCSQTKKIPFGQNKKQSIKDEPLEIEFDGDTDNCFSIKNVETRNRCMESFRSKFHQEKSKELDLLAKKVQASKSKLSQRCNMLLIKYLKPNDYFHISDLDDVFSKSDIDRLNQLRYETPMIKHAIFGFSKADDSLLIHRGSGIDYDKFDINCSNLHKLWD